MYLKNAQLDVDTWIKEHGVRYFNELTNMAQLTGEVGEAARIIACRFGNPDELIGGLVWLLSDTSKFATGSKVTLDGGFTIFRGV
ncbi:hypothetical protein C8P67_110152 [Flavobacterium aquicola]|uniref:Enoyl-ACP reductase-like protein n=1 Tax=Flavobacterium aquicola TaxID=1682742 RepID=A0A3E0EDK3_9FLAO|nr:hypothetical protein C8P67_110152 [Flavobacterium aquicola]